MEQWVTSPLGYNILLSTLKDGRQKVQKYMQIASHIKEKNICSIKTKLFVSRAYKLKNDLQSSINVDEVQEVDFSKIDNVFNGWVNSIGEIRNYDFKKELNSKTNYVLANISTLRSSWAFNGVRPVMKIYNSFTYTQDVKYEARLLKLPLESNLQLIILVPNEVDALKNLYITLRDQGLKAAVRSIQPLFTVKSNINAPNISFTSRIETREKINGNVKIVEFGELNINENGTYVTVLSCFYPGLVPAMRAFRNMEKLIKTSRLSLEHSKDKRARIA